MKSLVIAAIAGVALTAWLRHRRENGYDVAAWWGGSRPTATKKTYESRRERRAGIPFLFDIATLAAESSRVSIETAVLTLRSACDEFDEAYDATFVYDAPHHLDKVRRLYDVREDALIAANEIRFRLPNDRDVEKKFVEAYESLETTTSSRIDDAKKRLNVFVHPGPLGFQKGHYRASNDVFV